MSVKDKLALLKKNLPQAEPKVKIIEKVVAKPIDFSKEFIKTFTQDEEALPNFVDLFGSLSTSKKRALVAQLEYLLLTANTVDGSGSAANGRSKKDRSELISAVQNSGKEGYRQTEVAEMLGVSPSAVNNYIKTGKLTINAKVISKQDLIEFLSTK